MRINDKAKILTGDPIVRIVKVERLGPPLWCTSEHRLLTWPVVANLASTRVLVLRELCTFAGVVLPTACRLTVRCCRLFAG